MKNILIPKTAAFIVLCIIVVLGGIIFLSTREKNTANTPKNQNTTQTNTLKDREITLSAPNKTLLQKYVSEFNISGKEILIGKNRIPYSSIKDITVQVTDTYSPEYEQLLSTQKNGQPVPAHAILGTKKNDTLIISIYLDKEEILDRLTASDLENVINYSVVFYLYTHTNGAMSAQDFQNFGNRVKQIQGTGVPLITVIGK